MRVSNKEVFIALYVFLIAFCINSTNAWFVLKYQFRDGWINGLTDVCITIVIRFINMYYLFLTDSNIITPLNIYN